jgi:hypothetical protein
LKVLRLVEYVCKDTTAILKVLLGMALRGQLRGLIVLYRTDDGREETVYTGAYRANSRQAASATLSASMELLRANGEIPKF